MQKSGWEYDLILSRSDHLKWLDQSFLPLPLAIIDCSSVFFY